VEPSKGLTVFRGKPIIVTGLLLIALCVAYDIKSSPPTYSDSATVVFSATGGLVSPSRHPAASSSLIVTEVMLTEGLLTQSGLARAHGGGAQGSISAVPCNQYSMQYPDYAEPCAALTATAPQAAVAQRTFWLAYRLLTTRLRELQMRSGVRPRSRIYTWLAGSTGPVPQRGSHARVYAGVALLALLSLLAVSGLFGGRASRFRRGRRRAA
jgi:hypothetical protein